jgi:hypothetical protein
VKCIIIKQAAYHGQDNKTCRAYRRERAMVNGIAGHADKPLGVSANSTNSALVAARRCAVKAFASLPSQRLTRTKLRRASKSKNYFAARLFGWRNCRT